MESPLAPDERAPPVGSSPSSSSPPPPQPQPPRGAPSSLLSCSESSEDESVSSEEAGQSLEPDSENVCGLCSCRLQQPRMLACLHVFCTACLEKQVEGEESAIDDEVAAGNGAATPEGIPSPTDVAIGGSTTSSASSPPQTPTTNASGGSGSIVCCVCKQETRLGGKGVEDLPVDVVLMQLLEKSGGNGNGGSGEVEIICTSCKARENAVARCADCANFLCPACVTAHQFMRCFENHKVVSFEEMESGQGLDLQKPMFCAVHITENLKYFCETCQLPVCQECTVSAHPAPLHHYEKICDIEGKTQDELRLLVSESKGKLKFCDQASASLESGLSDLQMQRDNARGLIEETFQTYRAILEKVQEELVKELEKRHHEQELAIMDMFHNIEKTSERIEDGCQFTERVLEHGTAAQILSLKRHISTQLLRLINNTPKPEVGMRLEFHTDPDQFEEAVRRTFGRLSVHRGGAGGSSGEGEEEEVGKADDEIETDGEEEPDLAKTGLAQEMTASLVRGSLSLPPGLIGPPTGVATTPILPPAVTAATAATDFLPNMVMPPPLSLASMAASLASSISVVDSISSMASTLPPLSSERSSSRNSYSPAMSDSGISVDAASTSSNSTQPLVKVGNLSVNQQGQITLNNQAIPGLNVNNVTGLPQPLAPRSHTPTPSQQPTDPTSLANLLSSVGLGTTRSQTPQLPDIPGLAGLLNPTPSLNGIGGLNPITGASGLLGPHLPSPGVPNLAGLQGNINVSLSTPPPSYNSATGSAPPFPTRSSGKMSAMQIRCKFGQLGPGKGQFNSPHGFCLGLEEDIIVADTNNHRVQVFEKTGEFKYQFGIPGREEGQLWYPRKVAVIRHTGRYVVCDRGNERSRMQIFTKNGHFIKKIAIRYIDIVAGLAISSQGTIVAVDSVSPTVFCIEESGNLLKWFDCSDYMREPSDIAVAGKEYFVCDFKGHCVVVFNEDGQFVRRIGCESITNFPNGIDISDAGDVLVGDSHGNRFHVAVFQRDGSLIGEFECPYVKVSRCCGLRITSEGFVVTLAKNNHHVLILNTLYIA